MRPPYERKILRNEICNFLIGKLREQDTIGKPLIFGLQEMSGLLDYAISKREDDKIRDLARELSILHDERFGPVFNKAALTIENIEVLENFVANFKANEELVVRCSSANLEEYLFLLKEATARAEIAQVRRRIESAQNGGVKILSGNRSIRIRGGRGSHMRANIVRLMFGEKLFTQYPRPGREVDSIFSLHADYERGDLIPYSDVAHILNNAPDADAHQISERDVKEAVVSMNKRAVEERSWGAEIFNANTPRNFSLIP